MKIKSITYGTGMIQLRPHLDHSTQAILLKEHMNGMPMEHTRFVSRLKIFMEQKAIGPNLTVSNS